MKIFLGTSNVIINFLCSQCTTGNSRKLLDKKWDSRRVTPSTTTHTLKNSTRSLAEVTQFPIKMKHKQQTLPLTIRSTNSQKIITDARSNENPNYINGQNRKVDVLPMSYKVEISKGWRLPIPNPITFPTKASSLKHTKCIFLPFITTRYGSLYSFWDCSPQGKLFLTVKLLILDRMPCRLKKQFYF